MVKINELKTGMNNLNLKAKVAEMTEPREVMTKFGTVTSLIEATLEDETETIIDSQGIHALDTEKPIQFEREAIDQLEDKREEDWALQAA